MNTVAKAVPIVMNRPRGKTTGREVISSCNFKNVIIDPVKEIEPITTVKTVANKATKPSVAPAFKNSIDETAIAAPPPTPLNKATICGI